MPLCVLRTVVPKGRLHPRFVHAGCQPYSDNPLIL